MYKRCFFILYFILLISFVCNSRDNSVNAQDIAAKYKVSADLARRWLSVSERYGVSILEASQIVGVMKREGISPDRVIECYKLADEFNVDIARAIDYDGDSEKFAISLEKIDKVYRTVVEPYHVSNISKAIDYYDIKKSYGIESMARVKELYNDVIYYLKSNGVEWDYSRTGLAKMVSKEKNRNVPYPVAEGLELESDYQYYDTLSFELEVSNKKGKDDNYRMCGTY